MLSVNAAIVKTTLVRGLPGRASRVMVAFSREANFLPDTEPLFTGSLADPVTHSLTMRFGF